MRIQLVLAVVAAVRGIRAVLGPRHFFGVNNLVPEVERVRDGGRKIAMTLGITGTVSGDAETAGTEDAGGRDREEGAVDAAAVSHEDRTETGEPGVERCCLRVELSVFSSRGGRQRSVAHSSQSSLSASSSSSRSSTSSSPSKSPS